MKSTCGEASWRPFRAPPLSLGAVCPEVALVSLAYLWLPSLHASGVRDSSFEAFALVSLAYPVLSRLRREENCIALQTQTLPPEETLPANRDNGSVKIYPNRGGSIETCSMRNRSGATEW